MNNVSNVDNSIRDLCRSDSRFQELVVEVNKVFHELDAVQYSSEHGEIFVDELSRWRKIGSKFKDWFSDPKQVLDIGTGTGFVPYAISEFLDEHDSITCVDVSREMLLQCENRLNSIGLKASASYFLSDGNELPLEPLRFDLITLNSVIHHLPSPVAYLESISKRLKPQGVLVIAHEPNSNHAKSKIHVLAKKIFRRGPIIHWPFKFFRKVFRRNQKTKFDLVGAKQSVSEYEARVLSNVRKIVADFDLLIPIETLDDVWAITDLHDFRWISPFHLAGGLSMHSLLRNIPELEMISFETYSHLHKLGDNSFRGRIWEKVLGLVAPNSGSTFCAVIKRV
jgi:ubiquinone/menaquinone biosynthesis C-methylase UbiE